MAGEADPAHALEALENSLRLAIRSVLGDSWETVFDSEKTSRIVERQDEDRRHRHGAIVNDDRLAYTELHDLHTIIDKRWADGFKDVFGDKRRFDVYLKTVEGLRNVSAHNRQFLPFEVDLISGVSGRIRNQVTLYRSSQDPASGSTQSSSRSPIASARPGAPPLLQGLMAVAAHRRERSAWNAVTR